MDNKQISGKGGKTVKHNSVAPQGDFSANVPLVTARIQKTIRLILVIITFILAFFSIGAEAASIYYVRTGATGANNGSDWTNAYSNLPASLTRDATYYVADGNYNSHTYNDPPSGSSLITLKKATVSDHGTDVGWNNTYGDGQASLGSLAMVTDYYVIDGAKRNENDWTDGSSYGFRISEVYMNTLNYGHCPDYVTVKYADIGGTYSLSYAANMAVAGFYFGGFSQTCDNWIISRNFVHNVQLVGQMAGVNNIIWEYNWLGLSWSKEIIRGQIQATNVTMRYNIFKDGCRNDGGPGEQCTGEVGLFGNQGDTPNFNGFEFYGNIVWKTIDATNSDYSIGAQVTSGGKIYNNTLVNDGKGNGRLWLNSAPGSEIRNNISYFSGGMTSGCEAATCDGNSIYTLSPPFINTAGGNFHLTGALQGVSLPSSYNSDMDGKVRGADGVWDRGAFEYVGGGAGSKTPNPPSIIQVQ